MHPEQIKAAMRMNGITPAALADRIGVSKTSMSQVISGKAVSARIRAEIAQILGLPVSTIWPPSGQPVLRRISQTRAVA